MAEQKEVYLYKITNPNGKIYIGQTVNPYKRFLVYSRNAIPGQHRLRSSIEKYGWSNHKREIITTVDKSQIDYEEKYLISWYNSNGKNGLNILAGGAIKRTDEMNLNHSIKMSGKKHSEERKRSAAERMRGNSHAKGSIRSNEFKSKLSTLYKGKKIPNAGGGVRIKIPILSFDLNGKFIKEYECAKFVANDGFNPSCVTKCCLNKEGRKHHKGYIFKYK